MAMRPRIVVIGSANMDLVVRCERIASPGETVLGGEFVTASGGKGANQAVAAARLGAEVVFVGRVGGDAFGEQLLAALANDGILTDHLKRDTHYPTGVALICVDAQGQNAITVAPGANHQVSTDDVLAAREVIAVADAVILQLEIPMETVSFAVGLARSLQTRVILNPAPISLTKPLSVDLLRQVDVLIPNAHEAANLLDYPTHEGRDMNAIARALYERSQAHVVVTLGADGCLLATETGCQHIAALQVTPVDTTAAGDCFTGALAVALCEGRSLTEAVGFATRAAALSVTRFGAQPSLPTRAELDQN